MLYVYGYLKYSEISPNDFFLKKTKFTKIAIMTSNRGCVIASRFHYNCQNLQWSLMQVNSIQIFKKAKINEIKSGNVRLFSQRLCVIKVSLHFFSHLKCLTKFSLRVNFLYKNIFIKCIILNFVNFIIHIYFSVRCFLRLFFIMICVYYVFYPTRSGCPKLWKCLLRNTCRESN